MPHSIRKVIAQAAFAGAGLAMAVGVVLVASPAFAQTKFPNTQMKLVVPFGPGGVADTSSRLVMEKMGEKLGQRIIIENVP